MTCPFDEQQRKQPENTCEECGHGTFQRLCIRCALRSGDAQFRVGRRW